LDIHKHAGKKNVVIVGGGGAGLAAAATAVQTKVEGGVSVIILEKNASHGGVTAIATGAIRACDTRLQKELGLTGVKALKQSIG
jgi:urocanate reductase